MKRYRDIPWEDIDCCTTPEDDFKKRYWEQNLRGQAILAVVDTTPVTFGNLPEWSARGFRCKGPFFQALETARMNQVYVCEHIIEDAPLTGLN